MARLVYFLKDMWFDGWKASVKLSLMWLVASLVIEDVVHGWYDIDWLVVITGFVMIFIIRLLAPALYRLFEEDREELK